MHMELIQEDLLEFVQDIFVQMEIHLMVQLMMISLMFVQLFLHQLDKYVE